jgi:hypothetical protein
MESTGIAVFAYNRPDHLRRVLDGLQKNDVKHLYVFVDGAADEAEVESVKAVRDVVEDIDWCDTTTEFRTRNLGLADSLTSGIDRVLDENDRIVVLEDDCVPSPEFIEYMRTQLDRYADDTRVMNVNGYSPPIRIPASYRYDVYFTYRSSSWGWGTWKSAWEHFEQDPLDASEFANRSEEIRELTRRAGLDLHPMLRAQVEGEIDSWAVWWSYAIALQRGICVNPTESLVKNIGHDGTGTHTRDSERFSVSLAGSSLEEWEAPEQPFVHSVLNRRYNRCIGGGSRLWLRRWLRDLVEQFRFSYR